MAMELANNNMLLEQQLAIHLQYNHYPPVPLSMIPVCIAAIEAALHEDWDLEIDLPDDITWRGKNKAPVSDIIEANHLDEWLTYDEGYSEDEMILGHS